MNAATRPDLRYMSRQLVQFRRKQGRHGFLEARFAFAGDGVRKGSAAVIEFVDWEEWGKACATTPPRTTAEKKMRADIASLTCIQEDNMVLVNIENTELLFIWSDMCDMLPPLKDSELLCEYANSAVGDNNSDLVDTGRFCTLVGTRDLCTMCGDSAVASCSVCYKARYCGAECQSDHWAEHKLACAPLVFGSEQMKKDLVASIGRCVVNDGFIWVHHGTKADAFLLGLGRRTRRFYFHDNAAPVMFPSPPPPSSSSAEQSSKNAGGKSNRKDRVKK